MKENTCPKCESRLIDWQELSDEEKMLAERLPGSAEYPPQTRKTHRFCRRCWYEQVDILKGTLA
jgi:hypothetical protein